MKLSPEHLKRLEEEWLMESIFPNTTLEGRLANFLDKYSLSLNQNHIHSNGRIIARRYNLNEVLPQGSTLLVSLYLKGDSIDVTYHEEQARQKKYEEGLAMLKEALLHRTLKYNHENLKRVKKRVTKRSKRKDLIPSEFFLHREPFPNKTLEGRLANFLDTYDFILDRHSHEDAEEYSICKVTPKKKEPIIRLIHTKGAVHFHYHSGDKTLKEWYAPHISELTVGLIFDEFDYFHENIERVNQRVLKRVNSQ